MLDPAQFIEIKASGKLPSPGGIALKVMELCERDNVTLPEIIKVLQTDPVMVGRILKIANSAAFSRKRPAAALTIDVIMSIGIKTLRQVVLAFSLMSKPRSGEHNNFEYDLFWSHSIATGVATQLLGEAAKLAPAAEMFTLGLLSNIGQLAMATFHSPRYGELIAKTTDQFTSEIIALEDTEFGYTHWEVSAAMMFDWGVPKLFTNAVLQHSNLDDLDLSLRASKLAICLNLSTQLALLCFMPESARAAEFSKLKPFLEPLDLPNEIVESFVEKLMQDWKEWNAILEISPQTLRRTPKQASGVETAEVASNNEPAKISILIVDDDPATCLLLKKILLSLGHIVYVAHDGDEGYTQALAVKPDIVITDIMMPKRNGLEMIKSLRETELGRFLYILVLTMLDDKNKFEEAFSLGADDYISKPIDKQLLQARLLAGKRIVIEHQKLRSELEQMQGRLLDASISNLKAQEEALTDVLTGLYNRRHALNRLNQEWSISARNQQNLSVIMIDIDHFKQINDRFGHDVGDQVICMFADILRENERVADIPCRFGGEEFIVILPGTPLAGARLLAERIISSAANKKINVSNVALNMTVSIGVAEKLSIHPNMDALIKDADKALYRAKQSGRNQYVVASV